jgi:hypothetical protein
MNVSFLPILIFGISGGYTRRREKLETAVEPTSPNVLGLEAQFVLEKRWILRGVYRLKGGRYGGLFHVWKIFE